MTEKNMMLITSIWNGAKTFRLIPLSNDSTYAEGIYDPGAKTLALMSRQMGEMFRMVPKLNDNGDMEKAKAVRQNGSQYKEERRVIKSSIEYYITDKSEIIELINLLAVNAPTFDYNQYLVAETAPVEQPAM